ncbi:PREDICTED: ATP-dependent zinc metalloprotease FTSH 2, chloroplastic-like [Nelumbo nucifera]|uniref:ATP-dependent zinc metalloprotease FTSH 2, chloroplastic-like n=1 Tax=Nelumbo nucifera TaxID=4432 RepID=A0A1U7ZA33_NELNU|nr:PREDICTED: ATP-dependent zinc metalloprotease FTSH 2, chloroplastic-like [Nelumbo nucifera]
MEPKTTVTFDDAKVNEPKQDFMEVVEVLKKSKRFTAVGACRNWNDFLLRKLLGKQVHDLFKKAKEKAPCIIFVNDKIGVTEMKPKGLIGYQDYTNRNSVGTKISKWLGCWFSEARDY